MKLATSGRSVLVADIQVSGQGVGVQDSVLTTQASLLHRGVKMQLGQFVWFRPLVVLRRFS